MIHTIQKHLANNNYTNGIFDKKINQRNCRKKSHSTHKFFFRKLNNFLFLQPQWFFRHIKYFKKHIQSHKFSYLQFYKEIVKYCHPLFFIIIIIINLQYIQLSLKTLIHSDTYSEYIGSSWSGSWSFRL